MRQKMEAVLPHPGVVVQGTAATTPVRAPFTALQVASLALPFLLAITFSFWIWRQVEDEAQSRTAHVTELLTEHVARALETQDAIIAAIRIRIAGMSWPEIAASPDVATLLTGLDSAAPNTNRIGIVDPAGNLVQVSQEAPPLAPVSLADRDHIIAMGKPGPDRAMLGRPIISRTTGNLVLPYSRPRLGSGGEGDGGVIWTTFLPRTLADLFHRTTLGPDDTVLLLRQDGTVLARFPWVDPTDKPPLTTDSAPMQALTRAPGAAGRSPIDEQNRVYTARAIPRAGASVVYGRAMSSVRGEWLRRSLAVLLVAGLSSALLLYLTRRSREGTARELHARDEARIAAEHRATAEAARADAEAMLRQTQRVEMLGQIAAGVVHDFRNTVQTVHAGASLIERAAAQGNLARVREVAEMLRQAATRGGQLTQRLLSFRKTGDGRNSCDPAQVVSATGTLLRATLGPAYRLSLDVHDTLPPHIAGHPAELDSALMNLVINARDAMPAGGEIAIALRPASAAPGLPPGRFMELSVTDHGIGMDAETLSRATEAFFTTKPSGGTGLGLSSIRGFVEGAGGTMHLRSSPGQGTTVTLWLPEAAEPQAQAQPAGGHSAFG
jgi:signal transduction histidine kinase